MSNPIGQGENRHPDRGNTLLTTYNLDGNKVDTYLWIDQFATDLNLEIDSVQLRDGLSHRPIRLSERFLVFSTLWNVKDEDKYDHLSRVVLREHWAFNLNENNRVTPMKLQYFGANKTWLGFIENASQAFMVTDVIKRFQFQMRIVPILTNGISKVGPGEIQPFLPTAGDVRSFGAQWYTINEFYAQEVGVGNEAAKVSKKAASNPITGKTGGTSRGAGNG